VKVRVIDRAGRPLPCESCYRPTVLIVSATTARGTRPYFVGMLCPDDLIKHRELVAREAERLSETVN
jgi:hypothetical protein